MIKKRVVIWCCCLLFTLTFRAVADEKPQVKPTTSPDRVLFVGNSFSFYNNGLHNHFASLVRSAQKWQKGKSRFRLKTISGGRLEEHIEGMPPLFANKPDRQWDMVVLQDHSTGPISNKTQASFTESSAALAKLIRRFGAEPVLFMTWAYKGHDDMTLELAQAYTQQGNKLNALVVPVGLAFAAIAEQDPKIELYIPDIGGFDESGNTEYRDVLKHPSVAGTYLAACVFYSAFYQQSPEGLPYRAGLDDNVAKTLQQVAWQTYVQYYGVK